VGEPQQLVCGAVLQQKRYPRMGPEVDSLDGLDA